MTNWIATPDSAELAKDAEERPTAAQRPYTAPVLMVYGSVSRLTMSGGTAGGEGASGMAMSPSEPGMKENLLRVGAHPLGIGLYLYTYKPQFQDAWGTGRQFGVMADEVERVLPSAVTRHRDGYRVVNYAMLGIARTAN